ncbi:NAD(P)/FAD-dependent oxidoreductase [Poritiphilus flavus]|uniref:FAD-dependent oxidoreductase n=1 Tax=Poritiphilus flavus TaxID=2697053 RepID=A0A6L9EE02_9FLAO|nr:FAD-dependent oxidoreductase [Poritiphilus flavus]NAS12852.1 FAD-dependent oxidoreductase [Poritiphilus flavus]
MYDYLIVGLGLAGVSICETLELHQKSFKVISDGSQKSSEVAAGLYNPVILKRFTGAWEGPRQLELAKPFYRNIERKLGIKLDHELAILRRFASVEEQNLWFEAADRPGLKPYMSTEIIPNSNPHIDAPFGFGKLLHTGRVDTALLLRSYTYYLESQYKLFKDTFDFTQLQIDKDSVTYKKVVAKKLILAMGYGLKSDPFFNYLPLNGTKGELLTIEAPDLEIAEIVKSGVFCIPLGRKMFRIGATYKWKDKTNTPTEEARAELLEKLNTFLKCPYKVIDHVAGIRPTVTDRRPLVGRHPKFDNLFMLNGLGSRGVLIAPYAAKQLFEYIEEGKPLNAAMDISRFASRYQTS